MWTMTSWTWMAWSGHWKMGWLKCSTRITCRHHSKISRSIWGEVCCLVSDHAGGFRDEHGGGASHRQC